MVAVLCFNFAELIEVTEEIYYSKTETKNKQLCAKHVFGMDIIQLWLPTYVLDMKSLIFVIKSSYIWPFALPLPTMVAMD